MPMDTAFGLDHITYQVPQWSLDSGGNIEHFFKLLRLKEIDVDEEIPEGWKARWFETMNINKLKIHLVEVPGGRLQPMRSWMGYGHICIVADEHTFQHFKKSGDYVERDSGSGRLWLSCMGFRVELRSDQRAVRPTGQGDEDPGPPDASPLRLADHHEDEQPQAPAIGLEWPVTSTPNPSTSIEVAAFCIDAKKMSARIAERSDKELKRYCAALNPKNGDREKCAFQKGHSGPHSWDFDKLLNYLQPRNPVERIGLPQRVAGDFVDLDIESIKDPQLRVFARALAVYSDREKKYKEHWKRYGWRGALSEMRKAAERAWYLLWDASDKKPPKGQEPPWDHDIDDLLDVINYAAFAVRAVEEGNRDGEGGWWNG